MQFVHDNLLNDESIALEIYFKIIVNTEIVHAVLTRMDLKKGQGPDNIPPLFLREYADSSAEPLSRIINKSLDKGKYPDRFKIGHVIPIFKNGKKIGRYKL